MILVGFSIAINAAAWSFSASGSVMTTGAFAMPAMPEAASASGYDALVVRMTVSADVHPSSTIACIVSGAESPARRTHRPSSEAASSA